MSDTLETTLRRATILVVEDSATQLEGLRFLLEEAGFTVVTATNGQEALAAAKASAFDLVISDIVMPEMDGYELCKAMRADAALEHLPVILLTSLADPRDVIRGLESGANNFICKPYEDRALVTRVRNVLANQEIRKAASSEMGIAIFFEGQRFFITADRLQILDLLLSTYENAVSRNGELVAARDELRRLNERLEGRVAERTVALTAEIEERQRAEEALRFRNLVLATQQEASIDGILVVDVHGTIVSANRRFSEMWGVPPDILQSKSDARVLRSAMEKVVGAEAFAGKIAEVYASPGEKSQDELLLKDGRTFDRYSAPMTSADGKHFGRVWYFRDITDRKRAEAKRETLEEQLRVSQKMEAIGILAGGVAHDFNNLLSVILGYTSFVLDGLPAEEPVRADLLEVQKAADRAVDLTRQLLAFGRKQLLQPVPLDLNQIAGGIEKMLRRILREDIEVIQTLDPGLGVTLADPSQIEQVLMNLVVNARDAMPEGGKLTIETANVEIDEEYAASHAGVKAGPYVQLAVTDNGGGMDQQTKARIFEPFFTTKEKGKGTGLGLSTAYGIVKQSGGHILVYSELGKGTTFKIYLPRESAGVRAAIRPAAVQGRSTGTETILLVEDDEAQLKVARRFLEAAGYRVLTAANGEQALRVSAEHAGDIDLLLTDVVMPRMGGRALAQELSRTRPALTVVHMSGYTDNAIVHHGVLDAGTHFVAKPFSAVDLTRKIREALSDAVTNPADRPRHAVEVDAKRKPAPVDTDALRALLGESLDRLRSAVNAARYDEIIEIVEALRATEPEAATVLRQMAEAFDYDGMRELLGP